MNIFFIALLILYAKSILIREHLATVLYTTTTGFTMTEATTLVPALFIIATTFVLTLFVKSTALILAVRLPLAIAMRCFIAIACSSAGDGLAVLVFELPALKGVEAEGADIVLFFIFFIITPCFACEALLEVSVLLEAMFL